MSYQWDTGQHLIVYKKCEEVHLAQDGMDVIVCHPEKKNGDWVVAVPDVLLQNAKTITAYGVSINEDGKETEWGKSFYVQAREKEKT